MLHGGFKLADFELLQTLYDSPSGSIYKARYRYPPRAIYVLKERRTAELGENKNMLNELNLFERTDHPNILKCCGHFWDQGRKRLFLVLEYADGGDLFQFIRKRWIALQDYTSNEYFLPPAQVFAITVQLCEAVCHLHQLGIVHRDIKTLNILLFGPREKQPCQERRARSPAKQHKRIFFEAKQIPAHLDNSVPWTVKIGDLGVSRAVSQKTMMLRSFYGTPLYASPELCANRPYTEKTDIWSLGVVLYEIAALEPPFQGENLMKLALKIQEGKFAPLPPQYPEPFCNIIYQMLRQNEAERPSISNILKQLRGCSAVFDNTVGKINRAQHLRQEIDRNRQGNHRKEMAPGSDDIVLKTRLEALEIALDNAGDTDDEDDNEKMPYTEANIPTETMPAQQHREEPFSNDSDQQEEALEKKIEYQHIPSSENQANSCSQSPPRQHSPSKNVSQERPKKSERDIRFELRRKRWKERHGGVKSEPIQNNKATVKVEQHVEFKELAPSIENPLPCVPSAPSSVPSNSVEVSRPRTRASPSTKPVAAAPEINIIRKQGINRIGRVPPEARGLFGPPAAAVSEKKKKFNIITGTWA